MFNDGGGTQDGPDPCPRHLPYTFLSHSQCARVLWSFQNKPIPLKFI